MPTVAAGIEQDEESDVKVPVEVTDEKDEKQTTDEAAVEPDEVQTNETASDAAAEPEAHEPAEAAGEPSGESDEELDEDEERARVEAAIRAGEQAAEEEMAREAERKVESVYAQRDELQSKLDAALLEAEDAKKRMAEASDRMLRLQADWENFRRRTAQERLDERERAAEKLVVSLLPVLDDMERAIEHASTAAAADAEDNQFDQFVAGVSAVHDKMVGILAKHGVEVINPLGEAFDPLEHQAVGRMEDADAYDETVAAVYQRGYRMAGRVIREAMVQVTYGGPKRPAPEPEPEAAADATSSDAADEA